MGQNLQGVFLKSSSSKWHMRSLLLGRSGGSLLHTLPAKVFSADVSYLETEHWDIEYSNFAGVL